MQLLNPTPPSELPTVALFSRIRGRRARLRAQSVTAEPDKVQPELELRAVYDWVYLHLGAGLRRILAPYLEVVATRQLILALRYRLAGDDPPQALQRSKLTNPQLLERIASEHESTRLISWLESSLGESYPFIRGLTRCYLQQGPGGAERQLSGGILVHGLDRASPKEIVHCLLETLIDFRNLLTILKHWHWKVRSAPLLLMGGQLGTAMLLRIWRREDRPGLQRIAGRIARESIRDVQPRAVERVLLNGLSHRLQKAGRDPLDPALILDYLWRCQVLAHNQTVYQTGADQTGIFAGEALLS